MTDPFTHDELIHFLLHAKKRTYANPGNEAQVTPLVPATRQLEYYEPPFLYRDIYVGTAYFCGQETVIFREKPVWSMSYAGGVLPEKVAQNEVPQIYAFLRKAMLLVAYERPFRGPERFRETSYSYLDISQGDLTHFHGEELILRGGEMIYQLHYAGGLLR